MTEEIQREQPQEQITQNDMQENAQIKTSEENMQEVENGIIEGSLGKFKDADSLLKAYNSLQAEFTKKCQSLSELKAEIKKENNPLPIYAQEGWTEKVSAFLEDNKEAKPFAGQIAGMILEDETLAKNPSALDIAFAKVASSKYIAPEKAIEDEKFISDYVLKNQRIKQAVLDLYLKELNSNKSPKLMGGSTGSAQVLYKTAQASSLKEAKEIVKQMLE